jgi:pimeloyl-ACP methyl ester carboxylesterase
MKKLVQTILMFTLAIFSSAYGFDTEEVKLSTPKGFSTNSTLYTQDENSSDYLFILLHGKAGNTQSSYRVKTYESLADEGYEVLVPKMPWSKDWEGTLNDGLELIDSSIEYAKSRNKKAILVGHSLGAAVSIIYGSEEPHENLEGIIVIAPGHLLHQSKRMRKTSKKSLEKAINMVDNNQGDEKSNFKMLNTGKTKDYYLKAKVFQSYYDPSIFPDIRDLLEDVEKPLLWIAGKKDRLTKVYSMADLFELLPDNENNEYIEIKGKHTSVLPNSADKIISWSKSLN